MSQEVGQDTIRGHDERLGKPRRTPFRRAVNYINYIELKK